MATSLDYCWSRYPTWFNVKHEYPCYEFLCVCDKFELWKERQWFESGSQLPIQDVKAIRAFSLMYARFFNISNIENFYNARNLNRVGFILREMATMLHCDDERKHMDELFQNFTDRQHALHELDTCQTMHYVILRVIFDCCHEDAMSYAHLWKWTNEEEHSPFMNEISQFYKKKDFRLGSVESAVVYSDDDDDEDDEDEQKYLPLKNKPCSIL